MKKKTLYKLKPLKSPNFSRQTAKYISFWNKIFNNYIETTKPRDYNPSKVYKGHLLYPTILYFNTQSRRC